ncbi:MAG: MotA/TolQ/ExbB proton channel family protein [Candidatus Omnitrophica bacterium]|nr:MotA/TolQ/ExbB proton channel family protein [Candidatus Omnitrophota bacterium]
MALTSIVGFLMAFLFIVWAIATQGGIARLISFLEFGSFVLVFGCSIGALIINYTFKEIWSALKSVKYLFVAKPTAPEKIIDLLVNMAIRARKEGFLSLREEATMTNLPLLGLGIGLIADGTDPEVTRQILETAANSEATQISLSETIWRDLSVYAPMFGMLGTVIGLIIMLRSLSDPASIGPAMSLALITTFYGLLIAAIICIPTAGKIHNYNERLSLLRTLIIEGLLSIQAGDNSYIVEEKLKAYLIKR